MRRSEIVCQNAENTESIVFPSKAMIDEWLTNGVLHTLAGFQNNEESGLGDSFNFVMSNGARNQQRDENEEYFTHMMVGNARIKSVHIYYDYWISGFQFFDRDNNMIFKIGWITPGDNETRVVLAENEAIVGVAAKLFTNCKSLYSDF